MCLQKVKKKYELPNTISGFGYKVLWQHDNCLLPQYIASFMGDGYELDRWYQAESELYRIYADDGQWYAAGFHVICNESDTKSWMTSIDSVVQRVEYRGVICEGKDRNRKVIVVQEIRLVPETEVVEIPLDRPRFYGRMLSWFGRFTKNKTGD